MRGLTEFHSTLSHYYQKYCPWDSISWYYFKFKWKVGNIAQGMVFLDIILSLNEKSCKQQCRETLDVNISVVLSWHFAPVALCLILAHKHSSKAWINYHKLSWILVLKRLSQSCVSARWLSCKITLISWMDMSIKRYWQIGITSLGEQAVLQRQAVFGRSSQLIWSSTLHWLWSQRAHIVVYCCQWGKATLFNCHLAGSKLE